jgi:hypothetical protein
MFSVKISLSATSTRFQASARFNWDKGLERLAKNKKIIMQQDKKVDYLVSNTLSTLIF